MALNLAHQDRFDLPCLALNTNYNISTFVKSLLKGWKARQRNEVSSYG